MTDKELAKRLRELADQIDPLLIGGPDAVLLRQAATALEGRNAMASVLANFEIREPDADGNVWLVFHGGGTTGKGAFNLGKADKIATQVALHFEADRRQALAVKPTAPTESGPGEERLRDILAEELDRHRHLKQFASILRCGNTTELLKCALAAMHRLATADGREVRDAKPRIAAKGYITYCDDDCVGDQHSEAHERREVVCRIDSDD